MRRCRIFLLFLPLLLTGCANTQQASLENVDSSSSQTSSIPWNKPESWETTGQLGGITGH